ncbi:MAG: radical SAM protein [Oligoflexia bacterium]|nr:radical SAM protein [Oligoflexia bacterium]
MRFTLINPSRTYSNNNPWRFIMGVVPPLGIANLAAVLETEKHEVDLIDANVFKYSPEDVCARIYPDSEYIGISSFTINYPNALEYAKAIRKKFPKSKIIMGGVHPSVYHENIVAQGIADLVIRGEGELPILMLARNTPLQEISNLTWKKGNDVIVNPSSNLFIDAKDMPLPAYHKLPMHLYHSSAGAAIRTPSIGVITSRGCPGGCTFCYSGMFGKKVRYQSADVVFRHIKHLIDTYNIKEISFYDDSFTTNNKRIFEICDLIISNKLKISWSCFARVDSVNEELLKKMKLAGCHQIMYGFESADEEILNSFNKRADVDKAKKAIHATNRAGIEIRGAYMMGGPDEKEEQIQKTINYSLNYKIDYAVFNITTPLPGTKLFVDVINAGHLKMPKDHEWAKFDLATPIMELPFLPSKTLAKYHKQAYISFYLRPVYILRRVFSKNAWLAIFVVVRQLIFEILTRITKNRKNKCNDFEKSVSAYSLKTGEV